MTKIWDSLTSSPIIDILTNSEKPPSPYYPAPAILNSPNYDFLEFHPTELARQLTLIDAELIRKIKPYEWLNKNWLKGKSLNIEHYTDRFNKVTQWVISLVVLATTIEMRVVIITRFVKIAMECLLINNFCGLLEIYLGLTSHVVQRLIQTWAMVDKQTMLLLEKMKDFTNPLNNFKRIVSVQESIEGPCIPYLGCYLHIMMVITEKNEDITEDGLINFDKIYMSSRVIQRFENFKSKCHYNFTEVSVLKTFLRNILVLDEDTALKESHQRETDEENQIFKTKNPKKK